MTITIIAILLENCPACEDFKNKYWNNIDCNFQTMAKSYGFNTSTIVVKRDPEQRKIMEKKLNDHGITYISSFPFIFAVKNDDYNIKNVIVYCADFNSFTKKFEYRNMQGSCRNVQSYQTFLNQVKDML